MEVSETSDNTGVQKSSEAISESSQEDKDFVVIKEQTTKQDDDGTTTTVVIKKKITVKNPDNIEQNIKETLKIEKQQSKDEQSTKRSNDDIEEEIIEYIEADGNDGEEEETVVETVVIKKKSSSSNDNDNEDNNIKNSETTTKTIIKKNILTKNDSNNDDDKTKKSVSNKININNIINDDNFITIINYDDENNNIFLSSSSSSWSLNNNGGAEKQFDSNSNTIPDNKVEKNEERTVTEVKTDVIKKNERESNEEEEKEKEPENLTTKKEDSNNEEEEIIEEEVEEDEEEVEEEIEEDVEEEIVEEKELTKKIIDEEKSLKADVEEEKSEIIKPEVTAKEQIAEEVKEKEEKSKPELSEEPEELEKQQQQEPQRQMHKQPSKDEDIPSSKPQLQQPIQLSQQQQPPSQVSNLTTREETQEDGFIKKKETIERNEIQDHDDGRTEVRSTETKTIIQSTHPPSVTFYNNVPSYQPLQQQHHQPYSYGPYGTNESWSLPSHNQYVSEQSSSTTKRLDLQKLFTPAVDADEILPKANRKLYASSAFYSPNLHPTVEDQVELARRISHSLSDISNHQSKGQTMYVNRKKRAVKWVHEGEGRADIPDFNGYHHDDLKENESYSYYDKLPLKLVMNPRGQVRDFSSVRQEYNTDSGLLSPDKCAELVADLNAPKGKGAELFAKRRKKSEKWIVDETNAAQSSPSGVTPYHSSSPNILPAYSDVGKQRVQLNMHQDQLTDLYAQQYGNQRVKLIKTPWEAALETGSAAAAFQNDLPNLKQPSSFQPQLQPYSGPISPAAPSSLSPNNDYQSQEPYYEAAESTKLPKTSYYQPKTAWQPNSQRDLAYKPSIPQGWNAPPTSLPRELYVPKEIPLDGYNPPSTENFLPSNPMAYQTTSSSSGAGVGGNYSTNYNSLPSNYGTSQQQSNLGSTTTSSTTTTTKLLNDYGTSYTTDTKSHYELTKSFPLSSSYEQQQQYDNSKLATTTSSSSIHHQQQQRQQGDIDNITSLYAGQQQSKPAQYFPITNKPTNYYSAPPTYKPIHTWKTQSGGPTSNHPSRNFNPSPLPYEKLAKFENPDPDDIQYYQKHSIPMRSPSRPPNFSPSPYLSSSVPSQSTLTTTQQQSFSTSYGSGAGGGCSGFGNNKFSPKPIGIGNFNKCKNYNTAARGWGQSNCYKPITFAKGTGGGFPTGVTATGSANMPYTDF